MQIIAITADVARKIEDALGIDFDRVSQEAYERREAAIREAREESDRRWVEREARKQEGYALTFAEEIGDSILVRIAGEMITDVENLACPCCRAPHTTLGRLSREAGLLAEMNQYPRPHKRPCPLPLGYPDTDKMWGTSPVFSEAIRCGACGECFDVLIVVLP